MENGLPYFARGPDGPVIICPPSLSVSIKYKFNSYLSTNMYFSYTYFIMMNSGTTGILTALLVLFFVF